MQEQPETISATIKPLNITDSSTNTYLNAREYYIKATELAQEQLQKARSAAAGLLFAARNKIRQERKTVFEELSERAKFEQVLSFEEKFQAEVLKHNQELLEVAYILAEKIIKREIKKDPAYLNPMIEEALRTQSNKETLQVFVNPQEHLYLKQYLEQKHQGLKYQLIEDSEITQGTVLLLGASGKMMIDWSGKLKALKEQLISNLVAQAKTKNS